jgi:hypothetical protein
MDREEGSAGGPASVAGEPKGKLGSNKKIAFTALLVVSIGLVANVGISFVADFGSTWEKIRNARWDAFALPFAVILACYAIDSIRLAVVARALGYRITRREAFMNSVIGFFGAYITPSATGGQFMQVYHLSQNGIDSKTGTNICVSRFVEFLLFTSATVLFSIYRLPELLGRDLCATTLLATGITVSFIISAIIVVVFLNVRILFRIIEFFFGIALRKDAEKRGARIQRVEDWIEELRGGINFLWRKKWQVLLVDFALGALTVSLQAWSLAYAMYVMTGLALNPLDAVLVFVIMNFVAYYIPTPGSAGGVEGVYALVLSGFSRDPSATAAAVLIWRFSTFYLHLAFELAWILLHRALIADGRKADPIDSVLRSIRERASRHRPRA